MFGTGSAGQTIPSSASDDLLGLGTGTTTTAPAPAASNNPFADALVGSAPAPVAAQPDLFGAPAPAAAATFPWGGQPAAATGKLYTLSNNIPAISLKRPNSICYCLHSVTIKIKYLPFIKFSLF